MNEFSALLDLLWMLATDLRTVALFALLVAAAVTDWRSYRIPNWLTFGGAAFALLCALYVAASPAKGAMAWAGGLFTGFIVMLPLYVLRVMGAGDVKLMAMAGAFLGAQPTLMAVLFTFVVGGIAALGLSLWKGQLARLLLNVKNTVFGMVAFKLAGLRPDGRIAAQGSVGKLPYGVCICVGTVASVLARQLGYA